MLTRTQALDKLERTCKRHPNQEYFLEYHPQEDPEEYQILSEEEYTQYGEENHCIASMMIEAAYPEPVTYWNIR